ncbi:MAG: phenylalanine--tRNA ligase subunit alpha [Patescibacteria group bacterium]
MKERILAIQEEGKAELALVQDAVALQVWEIKYLGRKSELNSLLKGLKDLSPEEKRVVGPLANATRQELSQAFSVFQAELLEKNQDWEADRIDVTAPGKSFPSGHLHPVTHLEHEIEDIFTSMGFDIADGPEAEKEWYNFDALNFPKNHPARDMQDTFWLASEKKWKDKYVMRTHTSPVQIRYMETHKPPYRIIVPGRVFRNEATDASHEHTFHQFECLMVDKAGEVSVSTFKYIAEAFFEKFFGKKVTVRLRPSFFPFTEPSFEFDISCVLCDGKGCSTCKGTCWLEIGGAGMVNQKVFEAAGYKRGQYQGFAWGFGLTRLGLMKYRITDIRLLMSGDLRFIRQF